MLYNYIREVKINMEIKERKLKSVKIVLISTCIGLIIRMFSVIIADQKVFSINNIDILILLIAIIGLIIFLNKKKKIR